VCGADVPRAGGSHVLVAQLPVNNRLETGRARRRSFSTAAGWFFARIRHASSLGSFRQNARALALMLRSIAARQECIFFHCRTALRCVSKHEGKGIARLILRDGASRLLRMRLPKHRRERRAGWSGPCFFLLFCRLGTVPGCGGPGSAMHHSLSLARIASGTRNSLGRARTLLARLGIFVLRTQHVVKI
jgi:hypothetical protein